MDLSVLIPARNEMFLKRTIDDVLANMRGETEVVAILDGAWAEPAIPDHPRVCPVYHGTSIGQRAATNEAARISRARYICKLDAHCAVDEGFDAKLIEGAALLGEDVTQIPAQYNLHAFDWSATAAAIGPTRGRRRPRVPSVEGEACTGRWSGSRASPG